MLVTDPAAVSVLVKPLLFFPTPPGPSLTYQSRSGHPSSASRPPDLLVRFYRRTTTDAGLLFVSRIGSSSPTLTLLPVPYGFLTSTFCRRPHDLTCTNKRPTVLLHSHFLQAR
ncbi:hypothetical protein CGRA01v4_08171 [Colletotrichum graminicola]|nr:hypothetical protein CGRA01v4_08171 [Colletotrichum graminicola]